MLYNQKTSAIVDKIPGIFSESLDFCGLCGCRFLRDFIVGQGQSLKPGDQWWPAIVPIQRDREVAIGKSGEASLLWLVELQ